MIHSRLLTVFAQGTGSTLLTVFTNPAPAIADLFGSTVAAAGSDKVIIGAPATTVTGGTGIGMAYLLSTGGMLLSVFTNPTPAIDDQFGYSVAAVGSDKVLVGAYLDDTGATDAGAAYLFSTNGALLTTLTNPTPAYGDQFGYSVAAVDSDKVIVGAFHGHADAAYLFSTSGTLLITFTNPTLANAYYFGHSVAGVGSDKALIGTIFYFIGTRDAGAAFLFSTNGALLTTFTNPAPTDSDRFGWSVAAVGSDKVLVGAYRDDTGASDAGAAYLFNTNGALLTTFTNPTPASSDGFGNSVAAVGSDKVLIGAYQDNTGTGDAGAAYLFSTNGTLLTTFTNPMPAVGDNFGWSVAAVGSDKLLVGAYRDDMGAANTGTAYLFGVGPLLSIFDTATNTMALSWPSPWTDFVLQQNSNGIATMNWSNVITTPVDDGTNNTVIINPATESEFFRLFHP